jgi:excisionase family DNA binding protein
MTNAIAEGWLVSDDAADLVGLDRSRIRQLAIAGQVRAQKIGGTWLIEKDSLEQWKATVRKPGRPPSSEEKTGDD